MPGIPYANPTLDHELWQNILYDLGIFPMPQAGGEPNLKRNWLLQLDIGLTGIALGHFGNGSDGVLNFISTGSTTLAGATLSGGVYTMTRDIYLANGSIIAAGSTIKTSGFRIFCAGNLVINGIIDSSGNAAAANVAGAALAYTGTISNTTVGTAGGAGGTGVGANGTNGAANGLGGAGGVGGANVSIPNAGGTGGTVTAPTAANQNLNTITGALAVRVLGTTAYALVTGGSGGGAGGGDGTNNSGAGGGGGGIVAVYANTISGTGSIMAKGGNGGNANATGNSAGGAGGGGGCIILVSGQIGLTPPTITNGVTTINGVTLSVAGGLGGTGTGTGAVGGVGPAGTMVLVSN